MAKTKTVEYNGKTYNLVIMDNKLVFDRRVEVQIGGKTFIYDMIPPTYYYDIEFEI